MSAEASRRGATAAASPPATPAPLVPSLAASGSQAAAFQKTGPQETGRQHAGSGDAVGRVPLSARRRADRRGAVAAGAASLTLLALLAAWALTWPRSETGLAALLLAGALALLGGYRARLARRRATLRVALTARSPLRRWLSGRIGAFAGAVAPLILFLPAVGAFALFAGPRDWALAAALGALVWATHLGLRALLRPHLSAAFRPAVAAPLAAVLGALVIGALHVWLRYAHAPPPPWADAPDLAAALALADQGLAHPDTWIGQAILLLREAQAAADFALGLEGYRSLGLLLGVLIHDALVFFGLARMFADTQSLALDLTGGGDDRAL